MNARGPCRTLDADLNGMWPTSAAAPGGAPSPCRRTNPLSPERAAKRPSRRCSPPSAAAREAIASARVEAAHIGERSRAAARALAERTQRRILRLRAAFERARRRRGGRAAGAGRCAGPAARAERRRGRPASTSAVARLAAQAHRGRHRDRRRQPGVRARPHLGPPRPAARRGVVASHRDHTRVGRRARTGARQFARLLAGRRRARPPTCTRSKAPCAATGASGWPRWRPGCRRPGAGPSPGAACWSTCRCCSTWRAAVPRCRGWPRIPQLRGLVDGSLPGTAPRCVALLEAARADPQRVLSLWRAEWQRCLPRTGERHAVEARLAPLLASHAAAFGAPQAVDGWALRRQLQARWSCFCAARWPSRPRRSSTWRCRRWSSNACAVNCCGARPSRSAAPTP